MFALNEIGRRIFLDRYAVKQVAKSPKVNDIAIYVSDEKTGHRNLGKIYEVYAGKVKILPDDSDKLVIKLISEIDIPVETEPEQMFARVACGVASVEKPEKVFEWQENFNWLLQDFKFVPGGRILAMAGTDQELTAYNCYMAPHIHDSREGIIKTLGIMTEMMSRGGGVGINLSTLRPRYNYVAGVNGRSSGSVSWGSLYSFVTNLIEQGGSRRGALLLLLNDWHPDIEEFITVKRDMGKITGANISIGISDEFMKAVKTDSQWTTCFPDTTDEHYNEEWDGNFDKWVKKGYKWNPHKTYRAKDLWDKIIESAWLSAEPGLLFIERANKLSNSYYYNEGYLLGCNPCGEQVLPGWAVCNLGAINLSKFVKIVGEKPWINWEDLGICVTYAVRFLDNVIDYTKYYFEENREQQLGERRVGLGILGLADMLIQLGVRYGSEKGNLVVESVMEFIRDCAYYASCKIAEEKGSFPFFDPDKYLKSEFAKTLPFSTQVMIDTTGIRNVTLLTVAPTGSTGTMVNTSTGVEPFFMWEFNRNSRVGTFTEKVKVYSDWVEKNPDKALPDYFVTAMDLTPEEHVKVQSIAQKYVDSAISKTSNVPNSYTKEQVGKLYELMYELGCKGGTVYRDKSRDKQVLESVKEKDMKQVDIVTVLGEQSNNSFLTVKSSDPMKDGYASFTLSVPEKKEQIKAYPTKRNGVTQSVKTPVGTAHITMNNADNQPFEVFVEVGKAGTELKSLSEALGRLLSLILRMDSFLTGVQRVEQIVNQLSGIGGAKSTGFGKNKVLSLPDAVAKVLEENYLQPNITITHSDVPSEFISTYVDGADICPSCNNTTFIKEDGCVRCYSCGHSEC